MSLARFSAGLSLDKEKDIPNILFLNHKFTKAGIKTTVFFYMRN